MELFFHSRKLKISDHQIQHVIAQLALGEPARTLEPRQNSSKYFGLASLY
jgi:hypothetical protein